MPPHGRWLRPSAPQCDPCSARLIREPAARHPRGRPRWRRPCAPWTVHFAAGLARATPSVATLAHPLLAEAAHACPLSSLGEQADIHRRLDRTPSGGRGATTRAREVAPPLAAARGHPGTRRSGGGWAAAHERQRRTSTGSQGVGGTGCASSTLWPDDATHVEIRPSPASEPLLAAIVMPLDH